MLYAAARTLRDPETHDDVALQVVRDPAIAEIFAVRPVMGLASAGKDAELLVERERAGVGAWYEFFPRSEGATRAEDGSVVSGTFRTAVDRLPGVADMGFDVLYLPPSTRSASRTARDPTTPL